MLVPCYYESRKTGKWQKQLSDYLGFCITLSLACICDVALQLPNLFISFLNLLRTSTFAELHLNDYPPISVIKAICRWTEVAWFEGTCRDKRDRFSFLWPDIFHVTQPTVQSTEENSKHRPHTQLHSFLIHHSTPDGTHTVASMPSLQRQ